MTVRLTAEEQDPAAELVYELTLTQTLLDIAPLTIVSVVWSIMPLTGDLNPLQINSSSVEVPDFSVLRVRVSGGTLGYRYTVRASLVLSDGERKPISFYLPIGFT